MRFLNTSGRKHALGTIIIATGFRAISVVLAWPYAVGFDTNEWYLKLFYQRPPAIQAIFAYQWLHWVLLYYAFQLIKAPFLTLDILALILQAVLALEIFVYAKQVTNLKDRNAFLASLAFTFSLITLRLTWDQYRMDLGLIFVLLAFNLMALKRTSLKYLSVPVVFLVLVSNLVPSVFFVLTLALYVSISVVRAFRLGSIENVKNTLKGPEFFSLFSGIILLGVQLIVLKSASGFQGSSSFFIFSLHSNISLVAYGLGFLAIAAWPLLLFLPLSAIRKFEYHNLWFYSILLFTVVLPLIGVGFGFVPNVSTGGNVIIIWLYWMISFPLAIFFAQALEHYWGNQLAKWVAIFSLCFLVVTTTVYESSSPASTSGYDSLLSGYSNDIPTGYLQSTVAISEESALISLLNSSLQSHVPLNSTLYLPDLFYGYVFVLHNPNSSIAVNMGNVTSNRDLITFAPLNQTITSGYTIWLTSPNGWYGVTNIPANFHVIDSDGPFSLYQIG